MKKLLYSLVNILISFSALARKITCENQLMQPGTKAYYVKKSKDNLVVGIILVGLATISVISRNISSGKGNDFGISGMGDAFSGLGCYLASIPFFVLSEKYSTRASKLAVETDSVPFMGAYPGKSRSLPTLILQIPLGKC